jgi:hypothetical protein
MAADIHRFLNPRFLSAIDLGLMRDLFARHIRAADLPIDFSGDASSVRSGMITYFASPISSWAEGLVADLHRVAELGTGEGMQIILNEARRQGVMLYPEPELEDEEAAPIKHEPKHVALHTYLHYPRVFEVAADFQALRAPSSPAEFRGPDRNVGADLTEQSQSDFTAAIVALFSKDLQGHFCRLGPYEMDGEINLVVTHGSTVSLLPVVDNNQEKIIPVRALKYAVLRYSSGEGLLRIGGVAKAQQIGAAEIFARHILGRPGFFAGQDARDLYTLDPISEFGPDFAFDHAFDERINKVQIVAAAADLFVVHGEDQKWRYVRSWESKDASGGALRHFEHSEVRFGRAWRLAEITFRVLFRTEAKRPSQVTVRLKPPGTLAFRRTRFEKAIHALIAQNRLEKARNAGLAVEAAE